MELLIDIGNTNTSIAAASGKRIRERYFLHTSRSELEARSLKRLFRPNLENIEAVIVVSVVPDFLRLLKRNLKALFPGVPVLVVGKDIKVPMKNNYRVPSQVGQDRLVTAYSAFKSLGGPVVIVDFGTAVTFDLVSGKGEYEGGMIFPGLRLALGSLSSNAALLPRVELRYARSVIGRDTKSSMNNGILYGYASMCDGIIRLLRKKYGGKIKIVATGGDAPIVSRYSACINRISPDLLFKGLTILSENTRTI